MTDVVEIAYETDLPVANMSCGYYKPHTDEEYINIDDVINTYKLCDDIFKYINVKHQVKDKRISWYSNYDGYNYNRWGSYEFTYDKNYNKYEVDRTASDSMSEIEDAVKKTCGQQCHMYNGYCDACMTHVEEMYEFFNGPNETQSIPMETSVQDQRSTDKKTN